MKGDFSSLRFDPTENFNAVLQQQGRVLLDVDWNEQSRILLNWEDQAGEDIIGSGIAAVPVESPDGFKIVQAALTGTAPDQVVQLQVMPGRVWANGLLCYLGANPSAPSSPITVTADYLQPPIQATPGSPDTIADGVRDIVVLEVSREALNAFQVPDRLLEPALGGVDTTERVLLRLAFKLYRAADGETCHSIAGLLGDDFSTRGKLTVQLQPTTTVPGDCPVVMGGGYTGFEHYFYRLEIAALDSAQPPSFKWSQFNGGLVGRGQLVSTPSNRITIRANHAAIVNSGLSSFYCEVLAFDADRGAWSPSFGADVTLSGSDLVVGTVRLGAFAATTDTVFFRLWNGLEAISDYDAGTPTELLDGIQLQFDAPSGANYVPGDYWTFTVRAGEIGNADTLIDDQPPFGPVHQRVPLAEIDWGDPSVPVVPPDIEDCRKPFRPLTRQDTCCTVRVGDGETSLGDYTSIQAAIDALPAAGGMVCILPGTYQENVTLDNLTNVTLSGCGDRTKLMPAASDATDAVITIHGGSALRIESLAIESAPGGRGIDALGYDPFAKTEQTAKGTISGLAIDEVSVLSTKLAGICVAYAQNLTITNCLVQMIDETCAEHAVMILADDVTIEGNTIEVPGRRWETFHQRNGELPFVPGTFALGGLHLLSLCERVRVVDNLIRGGSGQGITLGSYTWYDGDGNPVPPETQPTQPDPDPCDPTHPAGNEIELLSIDFQDFGLIKVGAGGPLYDITIERNRIQSMGADGIGVIGFFDLSGADEFITVVNLNILGNEITGCLARDLTSPSKALEDFSGFGGIALADVENLVIHDNTIVDNGADWYNPVCGIFVLHGEGIDIGRNRIVNTGATTDQPVTGAHRGQRGGIVIRYALPPTNAITTIVGPGVVQNGVPALRVHDNIVSQPLGHALTANGVGPMSIVANQFTSQAVVPHAADALGFLAGAVQIVNLGMSNEFYLQLLLFEMLGQAAAQNYIVGSSQSAVSAGRKGLDDATLGHLLANGQVLFNNNQVNLDLLAKGVSFALASIFIVTLDDLACHDNQCEANLLDDFLLAHAIHFAFSHAASGNRWKEGLFNALLSALTLSFTMNTTTDNQGTHCIVARGMPSLIVDDDNIALLQGVLGESTGVCDKFAALLSHFAKLKA